MNNKILTEDQLLFQEAVRAFMKKKVQPHYEQWEKDGQVGRDIWLKAGTQGILCPDFPEEYGGLGLTDYRYNAIIAEEMAYIGASGPGFTVHNDVIAPYFAKYCNTHQKQKYMPKLISGQCISAIAMSEPGTGSDLQSIRTTAIRSGDHYIVNGSKIFISNGILCDVVILVVKTDPHAAHKGFSLLLVDANSKGFSRGQNLDKIGMKGQDTAELFFEDVNVPVENLLGEEGRGFYYLMNNLPQERLSIAVSGLAAAEAALEWTVQYCQDRKAFGKPIGSFQNSRFKLAEMKTELMIGRSFVDECILELTEESLSPEKAAMAKYWITDLQWKVIDQCLQLHGGYGYMNEYKIARAFRDARAQRIYGGTNEIMKEIIGRSMGF